MDKLTLFGLFAVTALVAALGLLPAALATGVGTDTQRPFALVIVAGLNPTDSTSVLAMTSSPWANRGRMRIITSTAVSQSLITTIMVA
jgi:Cu/Ag efflux pump CusA